MKPDTARKILEKEAKFLGVNPIALFEMIKANGKMVFSEKVVEAYEVYSIDFAIRTKHHQFN